MHNLNPPIILYLDMKPSSIIIDAKGNAKLIDFELLYESDISRKVNGLFNVKQN